MTVVMKELKSLPDPDWSADLLSIADLFEKDGPLRNEFLLGPVVDKWFVCGNGGRHLNGHRRKFLAILWISQIIYYWMNFTQ